MARLSEPYARNRLPWRQVRSTFTTQIQRPSGAVETIALERLVCGHVTRRPRDSRHLQGSRRRCDRCGRARR